MKQVTAIIEKSTDGLFSVYIENNPLRYGVIGEGKTVAEALEDFKGGYEDMRDYYKSEGKDFEEAEFSFKYDIYISRVGTYYRCESTAIESLYQRV